MHQRKNARPLALRASYQMRRAARAFGSPYPSTRDGNGPAQCTGGGKQKGHGWYYVPMAKVDGPLFSVAAHGSIYNLLTFRKRGVVNTVSRMVRANPDRSPAQLARQQAIKDAAKSWKSLTVVSRTAWKTCGALSGLTGWGLYWQQWIAQSSTLATPPANPCG